VSHRPEALKAEKLAGWIEKRHRHGRGAGAVPR